MKASTIKIEQTKVKRPCETHGDRVEVAIRTEDSLGFTRITHVCEGCFDDAVQSYLSAASCSDCGEPVPDGMGFELDGVLTPLCLGCQGRRLARAK
jgi:hypothetical protein